MKKYLIGLILLNLVVIGYMAVKSKELKAQHFTINTQQRTIRELKDQFSRVASDYILASSVVLSNDSAAKPKIIVRLRINGCELCNVQVLKKIATLPLVHQSRFVVYSDNLTSEKLKQNYGFNPPGVAVEVREHLDLDDKFKEPKSYLLAYGSGGRLASLFVPEYDLPELIDGYFGQILK